MKKRKTQTKVLSCAGLDVEVALKSMKYIRLKVLPPDGEVKVSAPYHVSMRDIEALIQQKKSWIIQQQDQIRALPVVPAANFTSGESHFVFGDSATLDVVGVPVGGGVDYDRDEGLLKMRVPAVNNTAFYREALLDSWYRARLAEQIPLLIEKWQPVVGKSVAEWRIRKMKTRWGSCNIQRKRIWLSLELAKKPIECLEYVVVHEMTHLHERYHNAQFYQRIGMYLPDWKKRKALLNAC